MRWNNMSERGNIRHAGLEELDDIMKIYASARAFMAENGNAEQWGTDYPPREVILDDLRRKQL